MENIYLDEPLRGYETIKPGEYIQVTFKDTGCGIDPDVVGRIFEPFFTTKKADKKRGSGPGLSVVRTVVEDHHGYVSIESEMGVGTAFSLYFPVTREKITDETLHAGTIPQGDERILVVDDDPVQREVLSNLVSRLGYTVHTMENGEAAVDYIREHPQDLLVLDMVMGGIDGTETFRRIKEIFPEQKAVILSGYAESERVAEALRMGAGSFVRKPVVLQTIAISIRKELDK
jgi:CheY-like chemotaxis protein